MDLPHKRFVDPSTCAHTKETESVWAIRLKGFSKAMRGARKEHLQLYLDEFL